MLPNRNVFLYCIGILPHYDSLVGLRNPKAIFIGPMMDPLPEEKVFALIGEAGFGRLIAAFYRRIKTDDLIGPLYPPEDIDGAEQRLREFLIQRFGGPTRYSAARGHPRLRMRHAPFPVNLAARERWLLLMEQAMAEVKLPSEVDSVLRRYFHDTATHMINRD